jgi:hypothetical protein
MSRWRVTLASMEVYTADVEGIPSGNLHVPREQFAVVWRAAERESGWYAAGVALTCRWVAGAPSRAADGQVWLSTAPVTSRSARAYEELIEAEAMAADVLSMRQPVPAWLAGRPGWLDGVRVTFGWCWRGSRQPPIEVSATEAAVPLPAPPPPRPAWPRLERREQPQPGRRAVVPAWVVPVDELVRVVRRRAASWHLDTGGGGEIRYRGVMDCLDWVAGVCDLAPVSERVEPATAGRVMAELLAAEYALAHAPGYGGRVQAEPPRTGQRAAVYEQRVAQLGCAVFYPAVFGEPGVSIVSPSGAFYLTGVADTLRWLLGEAGRPPVSVPMQD